MRSQSLARSQLGKASSGDSPTSAPSQRYEKSNLRPSTLFPSTTEGDGPATYHNGSDSYEIIVEDEVPEDVSGSSRVLLALHLGSHRSSVIKLYRSQELRDAAYAMLQPMDDQRIAGVLREVRFKFKFKLF